MGNFRVGFGVIKIKVLGGELATEILATINEHIILINLSFHSNIEFSENVQVAT